MQLPITVDPHGAATLQSQIVEQLRFLIESGKLQPGTPVPTSRDLGRQLAVSRNTITGAYETLVDLGYLFTEPTIGTFVSSGCIRLTNEDIVDLYGRVQVGTRVVVLPGTPPRSAQTATGVPPIVPTRFAPPRDRTQ